MSYRLEDFTPTAMLIKVQGIKYKAAIVPLALVVLGFLIHSFHENDYVKFSSLAGLFLYLVVIFLHRVYRPMPPQESGICLSPVHGTVTSVENGRITIVKKTLNHIDVRNPMTGMTFGKVNEMVFGFEGSDVQCELTGNRIKDFPDDVTAQGRMKGVAVGKCTATLTFPQGWEFDVAPGEKVIAGETILGRRS